MTPLILTTTSRFRQPAGAALVAPLLTRRLSDEFKTTIIELLENMFTFNEQRKKLNVPYLIQKGALYITYPHGHEGWELDVEDPEFYSVITYYNVAGGGWPKDAPKHAKPKSYKDAEKEINTSKPNLGNSDLIYDGKYDQIIWSIKKLKLDPKKIIPIGV